MSNWYSNKSMVCLSNPYLAHGMGESDKNVLLCWNPAAANQISWPYSQPLWWFTAGSKLNFKKTAYAF